MLIDTIIQSDIHYIRDIYLLKKKKLLNKILLTAVRSFVEQLFCKSDEHSATVNQSIMPSATVDVHENPKFDIVFNNVM